MTPRLWLLVALLVVASGVGLWLVPGSSLLQVEQWRSAPWLFLLFFAFAALAFVPRPALAAVAGMLFTPAIALLVVVAGTVSGAGLAFGIARLLGREAIAPRLRSGRLEALDSLFARRGFTATILCRLLPVVPYGVVNYGAGVTRVRPLPFLAGTAVGTLPANLTYITAGNALTSGTWTPLLWLALAAVALAAATWGARRLVGSGGRQF
ncbi:VTT domain-containing protein [Saccharopolyspora sp. TS4A08]|uniref:TVP38/TMEM64 family membrane protein n=1 Tax=Saccharopolyspora ipomoeae TaxID=3042027 RepID=A0ABT6PJS8_9PSEU|nr:VTT domain-containing protein [Saccharopolyspora sp. TS4A08]MDI2028248.1 VTT domain-containing protein [Saccharopolyspora sp. TS4A08]